MFFAGDSAGHCLPLTAEGIRTAFYFGIALGRELRAVVEGRQDRGAALKRYGAFSGSHRWKYESIYLAQQSIRHLHGRPLDALTRIFTRRKVSHWAFGHYLEIAPPQFAVPARPRARARRSAPRPPSYASRSDPAAVAWPSSSVTSAASASAISSARIPSRSCGVGASRT